MININTGQNVAILAEQEIDKLLARQPARDVVREKAMEKAIKLCNECLRHDLQSSLTLRALDELDDYSTKGLQNVAESCLRDLREFENETRI